MSLRQILAGVIGVVFASVLLTFFVLFTPVSGADYTAAAAGSVNITFSVPSTPNPEPQPDPAPDPDPQPEQPFDWNWAYEAPICDGITIAFPSNLPASQQGVLEVNVTGGSISGMQYKLEGQEYQAKYPNGHAGQTVFIPWTDFRNYAIPETGVWAVTGLQVHGTNYHWSGSLVCGSEPAVDEETVEPSIEPSVVSDPVLKSEPEPTPELEAESQPETTPLTEPQPEEEVARPQAVISVPSPEVPDELLPDEPQIQEGVTEE